MWRTERKAWSLVAEQGTRLQSGTLRAVPTPYLLFAPALADEWLTAFGNRSDHVLVTLVSGAISLNPDKTNTLPERRGWSTSPTHKRAPIITSQVNA